MSDDAFSFQRDQYDRMRQAAEKADTEKQLARRYAAEARMRAEQEQGDMSKLFSAAGDPNYNQATGSALKQNWGLGADSSTGNYNAGSVSNNGGREVSMRDIAPEPDNSESLIHKLGFGALNKAADASDWMRALPGRALNALLPGSPAQAAPTSPVAASPAPAPSSSPSWMRSLLGKGANVGMAAGIPMAGLLKMLAGGGQAPATPMAQGNPQATGQVASMGASKADPSIVAKIPVVMKQFGPAKTKQFLIEKGLDPAAYGL